MPRPSARKHAIRNVVRLATGQPWMITEEALDAICEVLELRAAGMEFTPREIQSRLALRGYDEDDEAGGPRIDNGVAILPLQGLLAPKMNFMLDVSGGTSTQQFAAWFAEALADDQVKAIVLDVDSPGGLSMGTEELYQTVLAGRGAKPIIAAVSGTCASAAYYICCAADRIAATPSSQLGSIGTLMVHSEASRRNAEIGVTYNIIKAGANKAVGNAYEPLSPEARSVLQERVDASQAMFTAAVAQGRGVSAELVDQKFGQGKVVLAAKAVELGMADRVGTLAGVVAELAAADSGGARSTHRTISTRGTRMAAQDPSSSDASQLPETAHVDPKIRQALIARGLIQANATDDVAKAVLAGFFAARSQAVPEKADDVVAALAASPAQAATPAVPAPAVQAPAPAAPAAQPAQQPVPQQRTATSQELAEVRQQERARIQDLEARAALLNVPRAQVQAAIDAGASVEQALMQWTDARANGASGTHRPVSTATNDVHPGLSGSDKFATAAAEVLWLRTPAGARENKPLSSEARGMRYMRLLDIAMVSLRQAGARIEGDPEDVARAALRMHRDEINVRMLSLDGYNRPSDFPNLMAAVSGRMLDIAPEFAETTFQNWAAQIGSVPDFRPKTLIATGEFGEMPRVADGDEFTGATASEEASWIAVDAYGFEWSLTPLMIVQDDLGALMETTQEAQVAHDETLNRLCVDLLTSNPDLPDGNALFDDTNHGNHVDSGAPPDQDALAAVRLKLRNQYGVSGKRRLRLRLASILVPNELETVTEQLLADLKVMPVTDATTNTFRGKVAFYVEPQLSEASDAAWYGFAPKERARAIVYTYQQGFERMKTRMYFNPKSNCQIFQFEGRFAAAIRNYRGVVKNDGE